jgi:uncharacterized protein DUF6415
MPTALEDDDAVYTVDRAGVVLEDRGTVSVPYGQDLPPMMPMNPPCKCPQHRARAGRAVNAVTENDSAVHPVDVTVMRETALLLLEPDSAPDIMPPAARELAVLTATMRGHLALLVPEVEAAARRLGKGSIPRYTALGCVWEARSRIEAEPSTRTGGAVAHVRRMARVLVDLCDQYEHLGGGS